MTTYKNLVIYSYRQKLCKGGYAKRFVVGDLYDNYPSEAKVVTLASGFLTEELARAWIDKAA